MNIIRDKITFDELKKMSEKNNYNLVKAVVDIENNIMAIDFDMHSKGQELLMQKGSLLENLWGVNLYPYKAAEEWIEYYSKINVKPLLGNLSCWVEDRQIQDKIKRIVNVLVVR